jgi:hypothetical protein
MGVFKNIRNGAAVTVCALAMCGGFAAAAQASTTHATPAAAPAKQSGEVYSCTTGGSAPVNTTDGGQVWHYTGHGGAGKPLTQGGVVYSSTTNEYAYVYTSDGGIYWIYNHGVDSC